MNIEKRLGAELGHLFNVEPALAQALRRAETTEQRAQLIHAAAVRHGLSLDAHEAATELQEDGAAASRGDLAEEQLDGVTGGVRPSDFIMNPKLPPRKGR